MYDSKIPDYSIAKKEILLQENVRDVTLDNFGSVSIQGFDFNEKTICGFGLSYLIGEINYVFKR